MAEARIPPQNIEAEKAVLGALLHVNNAYDIVESIVRASDFYRDAHRIMFEALTRIILKNKRADMIMLVEELNHMNKLDAVGGVAYITEINNYVLPGENVEHHAHIVRDKARLRQLINVGDKIVMNCYAGEEEADEIVNDAEKLVLSVSGTIRGDNSFTNMESLTTAAINQAYERSRHTDETTGLRTYYPTLDKITSGLQNSDLILIAARPAMGKTAFTLNLAQRIAMKSRKSVAFFSLEMSKEQLANRIISSIAEVKLNHIRSGNFDDDEWARFVNLLNDVHEARIYIDDTPGITAQEMRSKLRRLKKEQGVDMVIIDYIQLMQGSRTSRNTSDNRQQEISEISRALKLIARELNIPVIALSQLSRGVESRNDKRPLLSDLRESGSLEQDADIVMFLYRDKYYNGMDDPDKEDETELIIRKHRNGETGTVYLLFEGEYQRFKEKELYREEEAP